MADIPEGMHQPKTLRANFARQWSAVARSNSSRVTMALIVVATVAVGVALLVFVVTAIH